MDSLRTMTPEPVSFILLVLSPASNKALMTAGCEREHSKRSSALSSQKGQGRLGLHYLAEYPVNVSVYHLNAIVSDALRHIQVGRWF